MKIQVVSNSNPSFKGLHLIDNEGMKRLVDCAGNYTYTTTLLLDTLDQIDKGLGDRDLWLHVSLRPDTPNDLCPDFVFKFYDKDRNTIVSPLTLYYSAFSDGKTNAYAAFDVLYAALGIKKKPRKEELNKIFDRYC